MVHPLDQLTKAEAELAVKLLIKANEGKSIHIKNIQAQEPPKKEMIKYLDAEHAGKPIAPPHRVAYCVFFVLNDYRAQELWLDLDDKTVLRRQLFPKGAHPPCDQAEFDAIEPVMLNHPEVRAAFKKLGLTEADIKCLAPDSWMYGSDKDTEPNTRYVTFLMYMRDPKTNHPESNIYARPLPFCPIFDIVTKEFIRIDWCATGGDGDDVGGFNYNTRNPVKPITENFENRDYLPELREDGERTDLKPYNVTQPEGPSFTLNGSEVKWQKWSFRCGFNPREGPVLYDIRYDGRQVFYRLSVSEMSVPYGDPRPPLHRKQAFDLGDIGAGFSANSLGLGCDCLGLIKYFSGTLVNPDGSVEVRPNVVCMHEQDDGILLKHTNFRTDVGRVARRRILVLQTVITVANYEYIFIWHFDQAGGVELEIRATGVVSTQYIDPGKTSKWGNVVSPSVFAASHQHVFSVRIDPAIEGHNNTVQVCDTITPPWGPENPNGTAFYNQYTNVEHSSAFDADIAKNRYINIVNENKINPVTMKPVGYKLQPVNTALIMAQEGSVARARANFASHHFWVTKFHDNEFYGGGVWTNQSSKEVGGVTDAVARKEPVRNEDIVLWHSFGLTHHVRPEDWPVMPMEKLTMALTPYGFFTENPAIDVPASSQAFNRSVEVKEARAEQRL